MWPLPEEEEEARGDALGEAACSTTIMALGDDDAEARCCCERSRLALRLRLEATRSTLRALVGVEAASATVRMASACAVRA